MFALPDGVRAGAWLVGRRRPREGSKRSVGRLHGEGASCAGGPVGQHLEGWERKRMTQKQKPAKPRAQRTATPRYRLEDRWIYENGKRMAVAFAQSRGLAHRICRLLNRRQET